MKVDFDLETTHSLMMKVVEKAKQEFGEHTEEFMGYAIGTEEGVDGSKILSIDDLKTEFVLSEEKVEEIKNGKYDTCPIGDDGKFFVVKTVKISGYKVVMQNLLKAVLNPPSVSSEA